MSSEIDIRVRDLSKVYRIYQRPEDRLIQMATLGRIRRFTEFPALTNISLDIRRGETVGIVGRNGCGKSTLLQIICGTLQPTSGTVELTGRISALLELGAGFNGEFTGRENVYMNGAILGFSREEMDARFEAIAAFASIGDFIERPVKTYSSGMYVRLAFAVATAVEPDILVVDEALAVGDEAFQRKCFARIEAIRERGGTILFVSHAGQTIVQLCDRAVLLDGGEKLMEGPPKQVVGQYQRLLYADPGTVAALRQKILERGGEEDADGGPAAPPAVAATPRPAAPAPRDFHDPGLASQSRLVYAENGGAIEDLRVTRTDGTPVNVLVAGGTYHLRYRVRFAEDFDQVGFACLMKTVEGVELAGQTSHATGEGHSVSAGETVELAFPFRAAVLPGVYFFNAGTYVSSTGGFRQIHRIVDGIVVRVLPERRERNHMGLVDLVPEGDAAPVLKRAS